MFVKNCGVRRGEPATVVSGLSRMSLADTLECGQAFRYERLCSEEGYVEYLTLSQDRIIRLGQERPGEVIIFSEDPDEVDFWLDYLSGDLDYLAVIEDVKSRTGSEWLCAAADAAGGISILRQDPWEVVFSFIISQNNNIPRIRKIIRKISLEYGKNLALAQGYKKCPLANDGTPPSEELCRECGVCYSFPTPEAVLANPEGLLPSRPGFRYKYLVDAAEKVLSGEVNIQKIKDKKSYEYTLGELKKIVGVGDKVASCAALFGFGNLEAFPIDVWMKRAIDSYFDGRLDPSSLGPYAGIAQQYIFHYIRNLEKNG